MTDRGLLITFEGIDGSGKSSQAQMAYEALKASGYRCIKTREPGGSVGAEEIRELVLNGAADRWSETTELLLFTAARRDHLERVINPALSRGEIVICDRFVDSTRAYQGQSNPEHRQLVDDLHKMVIGIEADLTLLIDIDPAEGLKRANARIGSEERFEEKGLDFQRKLHAAFDQMAKENPNRIKKINGAALMAQVHDDVMQQIKAALA